MMLQMEHYEAKGIDIVNLDGTIKDAKTLENEEIHQDLEREARAGIKK